MLYYEIAEINPANRSKIIPQHKLNKRVLSLKDRAVPMYRSVYLYDEEVIKYMRIRKTVRNYQGIRYIDVVPIDIDRKENSPEYTMKKLRGILDKLDEYGILPQSYQIYYSGRGFHIMISNQVFDFKPSKDLPVVVKMTMKNLELAEDETVYSRAAIIRCSNSYNEKGERYKIPISHEEATSLSYEKINALALEARFCFPCEPLSGRRELSDRVSHIEQLEPEKNANFNTDEDAHLRNYVCIQKMLTRGPKEGSRNNMVLRIASHFKWSGIPEAYALEMAKKWNSLTDEGLDVKNVEYKVRYVYHSAVNYSCKDELMSFFCRPTCIKYRYRGNENDKPASNEDLNEAFLRQVQLYKDSANFINLKDIFDLTVDCILYPGEMITFVADTGLGKTSILQNIAVGLNMKTQEIKPHKQTILYYETELGKGIMRERFLGIVSGKNRSQLCDLATSGNLRQYDKYLSNINLVTGHKTLAGVEDLIRKNEYDVVIIDYIEKIEHELFEKGRDNQAISHIMKNLASMAQKYQTVIIALSQINRQTSTAENPKATLHSGKGSSTIETSSRRLFTIDGKQSSSERYISLLKANNDVTWKNVRIVRQDNWRYLRE